jgi:phosphate transport system protein
MWEIARKVAEMAGLAEKQITDAIRALLDRDTELAENVIASDPTIDAMQHEIEQKAIETLARRQPVAVDLREIVAAMRLCHDLERIGDHAKHIGKRVIALGADLYPQIFAGGVEHMAGWFCLRSSNMLDAYASHDVQATLAVWRGDEQVDALCTSLFRELLTYMMEDHAILRSACN